MVSSTVASSVRRARPTSCGDKTARVRWHGSRAQRRPSPPGRDRFLCLPTAAENPFLLLGAEPDLSSLEATPPGKCRPGAGPARGGDRVGARRGHGLQEPRSLATRPPHCAAVLARLPLRDGPQTSGGSSPAGGHGFRAARARPAGTAWRPHLHHGDVLLGRGGLDPAGHLDHRLHQARHVLVHPVIGAVQVGRGRGADLLRLKLPTQKLLSLCRPAGGSLSPRRS